MTSNWGKPCAQNKCKRTIDATYNSRPSTKKIQRIFGGLNNP